MRIGLVFICGEETGEFFDEQLRVRQQIASPGTELMAFPLRGPGQTLETGVDELLAGPYILARVLEAVRSGCDGLVIDCVASPGLRAAREMVSIPIVGAGEAAFSLAISLGGQFSLIAHHKRILSLFEERIRGYGLWSRVASLRSADVEILEMGKREEAGERIIKECRLSVEKDRADVIVLGCTGMAPLATRIQRELGKVPVIDPASAALKVAESLVSLSLHHRAGSSRTSPWLAVIEKLTKEER